ncbi:MAG TPA: HAD family hydrolase [Tepidisphaeraceae bacterium]|jgi:D-glycero-D-manno-heptose 1,7-bisphosphate phosphatase
MRRPAVFFDRDNTLIVGNDYLGEPDKVVLVAGAAAAVSGCRQLGFAVVVVSNQSGVARGMFSEADVQAVNRRTDELLLAENPAAVVDRHEYCPHHPDGSVMAYRVNCDCRKPKAGMIYAAAEAMALDLPASWMVGDAPRDIAAGRAAGCRTILIIDPTLAPSPAALQTADVPADFLVGSLTEAAEVIAKAASQINDAPPASPVTVAPVEPSVAPVEQPVVAPPVQPVTSTMKPERTDAPPAPPVPAVPSAPSNDASDARSPIDRMPAPVAAVKTPAPVEKPAAPVRMDTARLEAMGQQILMELKKLNDTRQDDFSVSKLFAGIMQTLALAALPLAYVLYRNDPNVFQAWLLTAIFLQVFTIALLVMGRQR